MNNINREITKETILEDIVCLNCIIKEPICLNCMIVEPICLKSSEIICGTELNDKAKPQD